MVIYMVCTIEGNLLLLGEVCKDVNKEDLTKVLCTNYYVQTKTSIYKYLQVGLFKCMNALELFIYNVLYLLL